MITTIDLERKNEMKKSVRILLIALCFTMLLSAIGVFSFAEGETKQGWTYDEVVDENGAPVLDEDGNKVLKERYYVDGVALTGGPHTIGAYQYMFADDGEYIGMYDSYKNVGTPGVMDTDAFKTAVAARNPVLRATASPGSRKSSLFPHFSRNRRRREIRSSRS